MSDGGKGDKRRPGDAAAFESGYDAIFGNARPQRGRFVWDKELNKYVPFDEFVGGSDPSSPMVIGDIQPYQSMIDGTMITSRSQHRDHLKQHNCVEVGNETKYLKPRENKPPPGLKQEIINQVYAKLRYK